MAVRLNLIPILFLRFLLRGHYQRTNLHSHILAIHDDLVWLLQRRISCANNLVSHIIQALTSLLQR